MKGKRYRNNTTFTFKKIATLLLELLLIGIIIFSIVKIILWYKENLNSSKILDDVSSAVIDIAKDTEDTQNVTERYVVDFNQLKEKNSDVVCWLKVNGTNVDYPIVQAKNNSYYLNHSFDKSYNSAGWPFLDYRNKLDGSDKNMIIYGHNRKDGSMFSSLKGILDESWYNNPENLQIILLTENGTEIYDVFSVYRIADENYYIQTNFNDNFEKFVTTLKNRSIVDFHVNVTERSQILTLSTCDDNNDYRVVLHAKKV